MPLFLLGSRFPLFSQLSRRFITVQFRVVANSLQDELRVAGQTPQLRVDAFPETVGSVIPGPAQVESEFSKAL
jgi:hypothetical protein